MKFIVKSPLRALVKNTLYDDYIRCSKNYNIQLNFTNIYKQFNVNTYVIPKELITKIIDVVYDEKDIIIQYKSLSRNNRFAKKMISLNYNGKIFITFGNKFQFYYDKDYNLYISVSNNYNKYTTVNTILHQLLNKIVNLKNDFIKRPFILTKEQSEWLISVIPSKTIKRTMFFIKCNIAFEIWLEYITEYISLPNIITIVKDRKLFKKELNKVKKSCTEYEMLLFAELCYLSSLNNKLDTRFQILENKLNDIKI